MEKPRTLEECAAGCAEHYVVSLGLRFHLQLWIWHLFVFPSPPITSECIPRWAAEAMGSRMSQMGKTLQRPAGLCLQIQGSCYHRPCAYLYDHARAQVPGTPRSCWGCETKRNARIFFSWHKLETSTTLCQWMRQASSTTQGASNYSVSFPAVGRMREISAHMREYHCYSYCGSYRGRCNTHAIKNCNNTFSFADMR